MITFLHHRCAGITSKQTTPKFKALEKGFSLLEVSIAILLFSIAIVGFLTVQLRLEQSQQAAHYQLQAQLSMQSLAARVLANQSAYTSYVSTLNRSLDCAAPPTPYCAEQSTCSSTELAQFDTWDISCRHGFLAIPDWQWSLSCMDSNTLDQWHCSSGSLSTISARWNIPGDNQLWQSSYQFSH